MTLPGVSRAAEGRPRSSLRTTSPWMEPVNGCHMPSESLRSSSRASGTSDDAVIPVQGAEPLHLTIVNLFSWPEPPERLPLTTSMRVTGKDLARKLAVLVDYLEADVLVTWGGAELAPDRTLQEQRLSSGEELHVQRRSRLSAIRMDHPHCSSQLTVSPSSKTVGVFTRSPFAALCFEKFPSKPVLLRLMQAKLGLVPDARMPHILERSSAAPDLRTLLRASGAFRAVPETGFEREAAEIVGEQAAVVAGAAAAAVEPASRIAPVMIAAASAAANTETAGVASVADASFVDSGAHAMLSELMGVKLEDLRLPLMGDLSIPPRANSPSQAAGCGSFDGSAGVRTVEAEGQANSFGVVLRDDGTDIDDIFGAPLPPTQQPTDPSHKPSRRALCIPSP